MPHLHISWVRLHALFLYAPAQATRPSIAYGLILLAIGIFLRYWVGKRKFNRRAITGVETFKNYESSVLNRSVEWLARLFAIVCIVLGVGLLIMHYA